MHREETSDVGVYMAPYDAKLRVSSCMIYQSAAAAAAASNAPSQCATNSARLSQEAGIIMIKTRAAPLSPGRSKRTQ